jgi:hypothetical protein
MLDLDAALSSMILATDMTFSMDRRTPAAAAA